MFVVFRMINDLTGWVLSQKKQQKLKRDGDASPRKPDKTRKKNANPSKRPQPDRKNTFQKHLFHHTDDVKPDNVIDRDINRKFYDAHQQPLIGGTAFAVPTA